MGECDSGLSEGHRATREYGQAQFQSGSHLPQPGEARPGHPAIQAGPGLRSQLRRSPPSPGRSPFSAGTLLRRRAALGNGHPVGARQSGGVIRAAGEDTASQQGSEPGPVLPGPVSSNITPTPRSPQPFRRRSTACWLQAGETHRRARLSHKSERMIQGVASGEVAELTAGAGEATPDTAAGKRLRRRAAGCDR